MMCLNFVHSIIYFLIISSNLATQWFIAALMHDVAKQNVADREMAARMGKMEAAVKGVGAAAVGSARMKDPLFASTEELLDTKSYPSNLVGVFVILRHFQLNFFISKLSDMVFSMAMKYCLVFPSDFRSISM